MKNSKTFSFAPTIALFLAGIFSVYALTACQSFGSGGLHTSSDTSDSCESSKVDFPELEEVTGKKALAWVDEQNKESAARLEAGPKFGELKKEILDIIQAKDRIPSISFETRGNKVYVENFWMDQKNPKGIFRRQLLSDYEKKLDNWEILIDVDAIAEKEKENWVFKGLNCAPISKHLCLLSLSRGGGDAVVVREYDLDKKDFVVGGFALPEGKVRLSWKGDDSIWVGAPHGPSTVSKAGYPLTVRLWKRGDDLAKLPVLFQGKPDDISVSAWTMRESTPQGDKVLHVITRAVSFFQHEYRVIDFKGEWQMLPFPLETELEGIAQGRLIFSFKKDAGVFERPVKSGGVYAVDYEIVREMLTPGGREQRFRLETVFEPAAKQAFSSIVVTKDRILISYLDRVQGRLAELKVNQQGQWKATPIQLPGTKGTVGVSGASYDESYFTVHYSDLLVPNSMFLGSSGFTLKKLRDTPARFNSKGMTVETKTAVSRDGTEIPYFLVLPKGVKSSGSRGKPGTTPTLIYAYGGFEIPSLPYYMGPLGKVWLEKGGAYVVAGIRGGGEFGPEWHQGAIRDKRQNAFDDLFAVAESVIGLGFTSSRHLGVRGGSNGGLLTGVALTQRPDLFNAVLCQVPLLDMFRYHKLLAGASWVEEYGDPEDAAARSVIAKYSPYQNLRAGTKYPEPFFTTSTRDDRGHPGHARRMVAKMKQMGLPVLYYENTEGGHAGAATLESRAALMAREYSYLWQKLQ